MPSPSEFHASARTLVASRLDALLLPASVIAVIIALSDRPTSWVVRGCFLAGGLSLALLQTGRSRISAIPRSEIVWRVVRLLFAGEIAVLGFRYLNRDALKYYGFEETVFEHFWPDRAWLIAHVSGGITALVLGPFQFWTGLRRRLLRLHRVTGFCYVTGVTLAGTSAFHLAVRIPSDEGGMRTGLSMMVLAAAWLVSTAMGMRAIAYANAAAHRDWMVRSYVLTFAFVSIRWLTDQPVILNLGTPAEIVPPVVWGAWSVPLFCTEILLQWRRSAS